MDPQSQGARTTPPKLSAQPPATLQAEPQPQPRLRVPGHSGPTESSTSDGPRPPYGTRRGSPSPAAFTDFRTPQRKTTPREHESKRHPDPSSRPPPARDHTELPATRSRPAAEKLTVCRPLTAGSTAPPAPAAAVGTGARGPQGGLTEGKEKTLPTSRDAAWSPRWQGAATWSALRAQR